MRSYLLKRLGWLGPVMFLVSVISFLLIYLSPGDPAILFFSQSGDVPSQAAVEAMRERLGLNAPLWQQYLSWITGVLQGDFGRSIASGRPVLSEILKYFPNTLKLTFLSMALTLLVSIPLGILAAVQENRASDYLIRILSFINSSLPGFFAAVLLIYIFSVQLKLLPTISSGSARGIVLPTLTLVICLSATYVRQVRAALLKEMGEAYIRMVRARGVKERWIWMRSALKSTLPTILTLAGVNIGHLLGGTAIIEIVFTYPGVGRLAVQAITARDYPLIQGYVLLMAVIYVAVNLLVDILHAYADPPVKHKLLLENGENWGKKHEKKAEIT